jgi:hypothetical protein
MAPAILQKTSKSEFQQNGIFVVPKKPLCENLFQQFLCELRSYPCGYWKSRKRRIREVFVIEDLQNPVGGKIEKLAIRIKTREFVKLANGRRFDINTGLSLYGEPRYIYPTEDRRVWDVWEQQDLRQRIERALPVLRFADVRTYADLLEPGWSSGVYTENSDGLFGRDFSRAAALLTERQASGMAAGWKYAKEAILGHLPGAIEELQALVVMMERDAK